MRRIAVIALHDLRLTFADRGAVLWMFLLPLVFATFFGLVTGGGSDPADARAAVTVVDNDGGVVARRLVEELAGQGVTVEEMSQEERAASESIVRTLVIPAGFSEGVLSGEQQTLLLEKEPGSSDEAALVIQARTLAAVTRVIGRVVEAAQGLEAADAVSGEAFTGAVVPEDAVTVETRFAGRAAIRPSGFAQSIPGMAVMFVMLVALTYGSATISAERENGQLRRLVTTPASRAEIAAGKIGGRFAVAAVQITAFVLVGVAADHLFGVDIGDRPLQVWLVLLLFGLVVAPLGVALGGWFKDPDRAANIGVMATMAMAAFGGCWWPIEVVSKPLKTVALMLPTGWAMRTLHGLISFGSDLDGLVPELAALAAFGAAFTVLATRSLRVD
ncbi:MAG TPA: ABC transporter permease [Chondromyces sp.]|nr:ABC transporter permease [Chondromyces sp.]